MSASLAVRPPLSGPTLAVSLAIKRVIVDVDRRYFLKNPKSSDAPYKILFCRLPGWHVCRRSVKVDILVPPTELNIPNIDSSDTVMIRRIPVMPLFDSSS